MWRLLSLEGRVWRDGRSLPLARPSDVVPLGRVGTGAPFSSSKCYDAARHQTSFVDGYLDRVEMSTLGLPLRATSSRRPGLLPLAGRVAARTQREVNAPLNVSCLIPFYKGQECGVYPRTGKGMQ